MDASSSSAPLRIPAHSNEAESSVLSGLLLDSTAWERVGDMITEGDFFRYQHQLVFAAISALVNANRPADVITVFEHLQKTGKDEEAGGLEYLNALSQYMPSAANIRRYAEIVRERSILRKMANVGHDISQMAFDGGDTPVAERLAAAETRVLGIAEEHGRKDAGPEPMSNLVVHLLDLVQQRADNPSDVIGVATGFVDIDRMTTGMQSGDLIVLAARPSLGKTSLALNIAENVALKQGLPVAVFSMEMGSLSLVMRFVASIGRINAQHLRLGKMTEEEWPRLIEAIERLRNIPLEIDETPGLTTSEMRSAARRLRRKYNGKLGLIVVDYLQLMGTVGDENRATAVGEISRGLKLLAKEMDCPVLALSQLSRGVEQRTDKRPMMSDLRESGAIEQDADVIMFIYRDSYYNQDSKEPGVAEVIISKQRNGPTGTVKLAWLQEQTRFESLARTDWS
jgi:replicative DNA helicase